MSLFDIQPTKNLVGKRLTITLEPKKYEVYEKNNVVTDNLEADCLGSKDCNICKQVWAIRNKLAQKLRKTLNIPNDAPVAHL